MCIRDRWEASHLSVLSCRIYPDFLWEVITAGWFPCLRSWAALCLSLIHIYKKLLFDRSCHVLYSRPCKKEIRAKIALHYPEAERETIWEQVQRQYADFLSDWRTDLGGKRNFHNGVGGTYDCIAIMSYYTCLLYTSRCV